jgi:hypothetical protein
MVPFGPRVLLGVLLLAVATWGMPMPQDQDEDYAATPVGSSDNPEDLQEVSVNIIIIAFLLLFIIRAFIAGIFALAIKFIEPYVIYNIISL